METIMNDLKSSSSRAALNEETSKSVQSKVLTQKNLKIFDFKKRKEQKHIKFKPSSSNIEDPMLQTSHSSEFKAFNGEDKYTTL